MKKIVLTTVDCTPWLVGKQASCLNIKLIEKEMASMKSWSKVLTDYYRTFSV